MSLVIGRWNTLRSGDAARMILPCCGSGDWARELTTRRPFEEKEELFAASDAVWWSLPMAAWQEAFDSHPSIGQSHARREATTESLRWSKKEQEAARPLDESATQLLAEANSRYEAKFGRIFIVYAYGRTASEILAILEARMSNDPTTELQEAAEQQRQITQLRLRRWLEEER